jgi:hypothetical protein
MEVKKEDYPWVFMKHNDPQWVIATLELMATLLAIIVFDYREENLWSSTCTISADTDNQGITLAMHKFMSTKWPLGPLLMELSEQLRHRQLELHLKWERRDVNTEADAITNEDFSAFSAGNRVEFNFGDLPWRVLPEAMKWSQQIYTMTQEAKAKRKQVPFESNVKIWKRKKTAAGDRLKAKDPW